MAQEMGERLIILKVEQPCGSPDIPSEIQDRMSPCSACGMVLIVDDTTCKRGWSNLRVEIPWGESQDSQHPLYGVRQHASSMDNICLWNMDGPPSCREIKQ